MEGRDPFPIASLAVELCRRIRAWDGVAMAIARWGYSRMRIWLDFSEDGAWPVHRAGEGWLESMLRGNPSHGEDEVVEMRMVEEGRRAHIGSGCSSCKFAENLRPDSFFPYNARGQDARRSLRSSVAVRSRTRTQMEGANSIRPEGGTRRIC